jgi:serralysin
MALSYVFTAGYGHEDISDCACAHCGLENALEDYVQKAGPPDKAPQFSDQALQRLLDLGLLHEIGGGMIEPDPAGSPERADQQATASSFPYDTDLNDADQGIDGLISGSAWDQTALTFSFPTSASDYESNYYNSAALSTLSGFNATQVAVTYNVLDEYSAISGLTFTELGDDAGEQKIDADLRLARSDDPGTAYAYYPNDNPVGGDSMFNTGGYNSPQIGNYQYHTFLHELGHALGLKHGHETSGPGAVPYELDSMEFTVMTYRSWVGKPLTYGYANETWGFAQSLMMLDIAAIQRMYGANFNTAAGDTTYTFSTTTGEMFIYGASVGTPGGNRVFRTVWDGDGIDTYDLSNYTTNLAIDLSPGGFSDFDVGGNFQRAMLDFGYAGTPQTFARGHLFNALQYDGDVRSLIENAKGGSGNDSFVGNAADNTFHGGAGNDTFHASGGEDTYYGDAGIDSLIYNALFGSFSFAVSGSFLQIIGVALETATDLVSDTIETIVFSDQSWSFGDLFALASGGAAPVATIVSAADDQGSIQGALENGDSTDDTTPVLSGTLNVELTAGQSVAVYRDGVLLGSAIVAGTTWTFADTGLAEGGYTYTAQVVEGAQSGPLSAGFSLTVDLTPPAAPTVDALPATFDTTPLISGTAVLAAGESLSVTVNGTTYSDVPVSGGTWSLVLTTPLADGAYDVVATVTDAAGNATSDATTGELVIDTSLGGAFFGSAALSDTIVGTAGSDIISGLEENSTQSGSGTVDTLTGGSGDDTFVLGTATTRYYDDGNSRAGNNGKNDYALITDFGNGTDRIQLNGTGYLFETFTLNGVTGTGIFHNVGAAGFDSKDELIGLIAGVTPADLVATAQAGNLTIVTLSGVDATPPVVTVNALTTSDATPALSGTIDDPNATIEVQVNGQILTATNNGDGTWTLADNLLSPLADGTYDVQVSATDLAGNTGTDTSTGELVIETVDVTPPTVTVDTLTTSDTTPELTGTINDLTATIEVTVDGQTLSATNNGNGTWTLADNLLLALAEGTYDVAVSATDSAGNTGTDTSSNELTIAVSGDNFIFGTDSGDTLVGTDVGDIISGMPSGGSSNWGAGTVDEMTGAGEADTFVLGEAGQRYYDDGNSKAGNNGKSDYALIRDFETGADTIQLAGASDDYVFEAWAINGASGTGIFHDTNGSGTFDSRDELIGLIESLQPGDLDIGRDFIFV